MAQRTAGHEWYRVPLESQQKRARHPWVFPAVSSAVLFVIDGPDFDCVSVTVSPRRILLEGGAGRRVLLLIGRLFAGKCRSGVAAAPNGFSGESFADFSQSPSCLIHDS